MSPRALTALLKSSSIPSRGQRPIASPWFIVILRVLAGLLRLGFIADFLSVPVLIGYQAGMGVVVIGIAGMGLFGLQRYGIVTVGSVGIGLPPVTLPDWTLLVDIWPQAMGIALMSFTSTIAAGQAFVKSDEPAPHPTGQP